MNEKNLKAYTCDNCGEVALATTRGADCHCGGTYSMDIGEQDSCPVQNQYLKAEAGA